MYYDIKVICTYNTDEVFNENDQVTEEEKEFIRNVIYRQELLDILGMEEYNEQEMTNKIHDLYEMIKTNEEFNQCILHLENKFMIEDGEIGLMLLFSYDYMYLAHICISEFLEIGEISETKINKLQNAIL